MSAELTRQIQKVALAGSPNCGKTALFNALTGGRAKVGNYAGVTVERKEGKVTTSTGLELSILDLPGTYSLDANTPDEEVTRDILLGQRADEDSPSLLLAVADATNLERSLSLVLELKKLGKPVVLALNMMDLARGRGLELDLEILSRELKIPIIPTIAVKSGGVPELISQLEDTLKATYVNEAAVPQIWSPSTSKDIYSRYQEVDRLLKISTRVPARPTHFSDRIDSVVLHPVFGTLLFVAVLVFMFQAIFAWASVPADAIEALLASIGQWFGQVLPDGALKSLIVDGVIAGVGSVLVFLPQILLLFTLILLLEDSGYMARAAFLMDRSMSRVGLNGRAFIPLLSSYACAIPGIMATRTIGNKRDRLTTILVAPLTTCSARLPVYTLLIAAFIPDRKILGPLYLPGLTLFGLYLLGVLTSLGMAALFKRTLFKGAKPPLIMEMPTYKWPSFRNILIGILERAYLFVRRAGTVILALSVVLWFLSSYPKAPMGATNPAIDYSYAGKIGHFIEPALRPIGFDWRISVALIPGFAAREVMVSALGTVYAVENSDDLSHALSTHWSVATALSLLIWYVMAPQCLSTLAVTRRETNSWRWPLFMLTYMTVLAYSCSFITYRLAIWAGLG